MNILITLLENCLKINYTKKYYAQSVLDLGKDMWGLSFPIKL